MYTKKVNLLIANMVNKIEANIFIRVCKMNYGEWMSPPD